MFRCGFLGLDNIGVFNRSAPLPSGEFIHQADATSWMAMYSLNLLRISLELARHSPAYGDIASKFFEHFLHIAAAINGVGEGTLGLWDERDEFYYDRLHLPDGGTVPAQGPFDGGPNSLFVVGLEDGLLNMLPGSRSGWSGSWSIVRTWLAWCPGGMTVAVATAICCRCFADTA